MDDEHIRFGIVAASSIADAAHAPALRRIPGATLWSVLSRDKARAEEFAQSTVRHHRILPTRSCRSSWRIRTSRPS